MPNMDGISNSKILFAILVLTINLVGSEKNNLCQLCLQSETYPDCYQNGTKNSGTFLNSILKSSISILMSLNTGNNDNCQIMLSVGDPHRKKDEQMRISVGQTLITEKYNWSLTKIDEEFEDSYLYMLNANVTDVKITRIVKLRFAHNTTKHYFAFHSLQMPPTVGKSIGLKNSSIALEESPDFSDCILYNKLIYPDHWGKNIQVKADNMNRTDLSLRKESNYWVVESSYISGRKSSNTSLEQIKSISIECYVDPLKQNHMFAKLTWTRDDSATNRNLTNRSVPTTKTANSIRHWKISGDNNFQKCVKSLKTDQNRMVACSSMQACVNISDLNLEPLKEENVTTWILSWTDQNHQIVFETISCQERNKVAKNYGNITELGTEAGEPNNVTHPNSENTGTIVTSFLVVILIILIIVMLIIFRKFKKSQRDRRRSSRTTTGQRHIDSKMTSVFNRKISTSSSSAESGQTYRERLWSFLSSSTSCSSSSSDGSDNDSENEDRYFESSIQKLLPSWTSKHFHDYSMFEWGHKLGGGQFGIVFYAVLLDHNARFDVAIKTAKKRTNSEINQTELSPVDLINVERIQEDLMREGKIMADLGYHVNIVNLQKVTAHVENDELNFHLVLEYCGNGSLLKYLKNNRIKFRQGLMIVANEEIENFHPDIPIPTEAEAKDLVNQLIAWGHQIANGMEYLSSNKIVHGDLAARNVLLTTDLIAKLSDFGLSSPLEDGTACLRSYELPTRWMAPETLLTREITTQSDVWSFGVTLWEIFSQGSLPNYEGLESPSDLKGYLESGERLAPPAYCPDPVLDAMFQCWNIQPTARPTFLFLSEKFFKTLPERARRRNQENANQVRDRYVSIRDSKYCLMDGSCHLPLVGPDGYTGPRMSFQSFGRPQIPQTRFDFDPMETEEEEYRKQAYLRGTTTQETVISVISSRDLLDISEMSVRPFNSMAM